MATPHLAKGQVIVEQVEAGNSSLTPSYAPINFNGTSTLSGLLAGYPSVTSLVAQYANTSTYSDHAQVVANDYYGNGSIGSSAISTVYVESAKEYLTDGSVNRPFVRDILLNPFSATTPVPATTLATLGIRVTNHSYVDQLDNAQSNVYLLRSADFLIHRDNLVWVGGAVNGTAFAKGDGTTSFAWAMRNDIAVRGDNPGTPFNPALGPVGRQHADVYGEDLASFICGTVSGYAAALIKQGMTMGSTAAQDQRVIKSVIMTGANGTLGPGNGQWTNAYQSGIGLTQNNLDPNGGAGRVDYSKSLAILSAGQQAYRSVAGTAAGSLVNAAAVPTNNAMGWNLGTVAAGGSSVVLVNVAGTVTGLSATLNWDVTSNTVALAGTTYLQADDANLIFADLSLELRPVTWNGSQYALGAAIPVAAGQGLYSNATGTTNDNVEHLYLNSGQLAPGTYALVVKGDAAKTGTAALSYTMTAGAAPQWASNADGTYTAGSSWSGNAAPNGVSTVASFPNVITAPRTVSVPSSITLGSLSFSGSNSYTLSGANGATLTLTNGALGPATVTVTAGNHTVNLPTVILNNTSVAASGSTSVTFASVANNATLSTSGAGTVRVASSISGTGSLAVGTGSTLSVSNAASSSTNVKLVAQGNATVAGKLVMGSTPSVSGLLPRVSVLNTLAVAGFVDLGNSDLIVHTTSEPVIRGYVSSWYAGGLHNGTTGIGSTLAGTGSGMDSVATLAVLPNSDGRGGALYTAFDGQVVGGNDVLVKYTYLGDTNLDGVVDGNDLSNLFGGMYGGLTGWVNGDTNYDGVVNATDLNNLMAALRSQAGSFGNSFAPMPGGGAVPEPASFAVTALPLALLGRRRRAACPT